MLDKFKEKMNDRSYEDRIKQDYKRKRETSESRADAYSIFLSVAFFIVAIVFFVYGEVWIGLGFIGAVALLLLVVYLSRKENEKDDNKKK